MQVVYSTLTAPQNYAVYEQKPDGTSQIKKNIHINGGHGLTNRYGVIIQGAATEIDDETLELLKKDHTFQLHMKNGFVWVDRKKDPEKVLSNMALRDGSSPATTQDIDALYDDGLIPVPLEEYVAEGKVRKRVHGESAREHKNSLRTIQ